MVINPSESNETAVPPPYPSEDVNIIERKIKRTTVLLISVILFVPLIICPLCNFIISFTLTWSLYVISAVILAWFYIIPPIILKHNVLMKCAWIDYFLTGLFLYGINLWVTPEKNWFIEISVPILSYIMASIMIFVILIRNSNIRTVSYISLGFVFIAVMSIFIEYILIRNNYSIDSFVWSLPVAISCIGIALLILLISKMTHLKASIRKRMHI